MIIERDGRQSRHGAMNSRRCGAGGSRARKEPLTLMHRMHTEFQKRHQYGNISVKF